MKVSNTTSISNSSLSDVGNIGKKDKHIKKQSNSDIVSVLLKMAEQHIEILNFKTRLESEKQSLLRELTLNKLMKGPCENL